VWDSGKVAGDQSVHVVYGGPALRSGRRYWWKVRTWDAAGEASTTSP
jgi:alpha-L-rhamnosidase